MAGQFQLANLCVTSRFRNQSHQWLLKRNNKILCSKILFVLVCVKRQQMKPLERPFKKLNTVHSLVHPEDSLLLRQPRCRLPAAETLLQIKFDKSTGSVSWCAADVTEKSHDFRVVLSVAESAPDWPSHLLLPLPLLPS